MFLNSSSSSVVGSTYWCNYFDSSEEIKMYISILQRSILMGKVIGLLSKKEIVLNSHTENIFSIKYRIIIMHRNSDTVVILIAVP